MKSILMLVYSILIGGAALASNTDSPNAKNSTGAVNGKLLQSFSERFPEAREVIWTEPTNGYTVSFVEHDIRSHIVYDQQGEFVSSLRYYRERELPYYLVSILKKRYKGKTIFAVTEETTGSGVAYYVKLQDDKVWMTVAMDSEGNYGVVEKYRKAL